MKVKDSRHERENQVDTVTEDVQQITNREVRLALTTIKNVKAVRSNEILVEAWE